MTTIFFYLVEENIFTYVIYVYTNRSIITKFCLYNEEYKCSRKKNSQIPFQRSMIRSNEK